MLEPNGTFYVKGKSPSSGDVQEGQLMDAIKKLSEEVRALRRQIEAQA